MTSHNTTTGQDITTSPEITKVTGRIERWAVEPAVGWPGVPGRTAEGEDAMTGQDSAKSADRRTRRTRRQLLTCGAGALAAVLTAEAMTRPAPAAADDGDLAIVGRVNSTESTQFLANGGSGVFGQASGPGEVAGLYGRGTAGAAGVKESATLFTACLGLEAPAEPVWSGSPKGLAPLPACWALAVLLPACLVTAAAVAWASKASATAGPAWTAPAAAPPAGCQADRKGGG